MTTRDYNISHMKAVGIKALKARLSEYLRMVKAGDVVLVTEREQVIAELRPAKRQPYSEPAVDEALLALADSGDVVLHSRQPVGWTASASPLVSGLPSSKDLLAALRKDSR